MRAFLISLLILSAPVADLYAAEPAREILIDKTQGSQTAINNLGLDSTRTSSAIRVEGWSLAKVQVRYTYNAASVVTLQFDESDDGTTWSKVTTVSGSTVSQFSPAWTTGAASANFSFRVDVTGFTYIRVVISSTGGNANDKAIVYVRNARGL